MKIPGFTIDSVIYESPPRVILRARRDHDGAYQVLKTLASPYPAKSDVIEIAREYEITKRLQDIEGVIRIHDLIPHGQGSLAIAMEEFGVSLDDFLGTFSQNRMPLQVFFSLAKSIVQILGKVHASQIVHKDIVPRNILVKDGEVRLIDFGISSELSHEQQDTIISRRLQGSLPYISPEQTGRMNRSLDYRSDFYTLGVSFFELLTGELPFQANNVLEWVHRHISVLPTSPRSMNEGVPESLAQLVLKLMSKNAEDRYQSTFGLLADLTRCEQLFESMDYVSGFKLGRKDVSSRFQIPEKLFGRNKEIKTLTEAFDWVAAGNTEFCMVSGFPGIGKTSLVNELAHDIARDKGYLIHGKFDQYQQQSAYSGISQAFRGLARQLLSEPQEQLETWRVKMLEALGPNGQVIVDLVPEFEHIIGKQPPAMVLPAAEAQNRLQILILNLVKVLATDAHPLVMFIDDLQWGDPPTLNLLQKILTVQDLKYLFVIGAYRNQEVDSAHPLHLMIDEVRKARSYIEVDLQPLDLKAVQHLTAETLQCRMKETENLSRLLFEKSRGNPFFVNALLKGLSDSRAIFFDMERGKWNWDLEAVKAVDISDNVVDFMVSSLRKLPESTQKVLQLAACIGSVFDLQTLSIIMQKGKKEVARELLPALKRNLISPLDEKYKYAEFEQSNPFYQFQHDRVQQAAYALIDVDKKKQVHLSIGRLVLQHCTPEEKRSQLINIVSHFNQGLALIVDQEEKKELIYLNLQAGIQAHGSSSYAAAMGFLEHALLLLSPDAWESDYDLMLAVGMEYQQCSYLTGDFEKAESWSQQLLEKARTDLEKAEVLSMRTRQYSTIGKMKASIETAIQGLSLLGLSISSNPDQEAIDAEIEAVTVNLQGRRIEDLVDAEPLRDPKGQLEIRLLMEIFPAAFLSGSGRLFPYLVLKSVNISLIMGTSPETAFAYAAYGMLLCGVLNDPALGYQYGKLAIAMNDKLDDIKLKSRVIYVYTMFIHHWSHHWSSMTPWFKKGIEAGYQSGDLLYLAYSAQDCIIWDPKLDLETAAEQQRRYLKIVRDCEYQDSLDSGTLFLQMQLNFLGETDGLLSMNDQHFSESSCVEGMRQRAFMTGIANYNIYKAEICYMYDELEKAYQYIQEQAKMIASAMSLPQLTRFYIISFLTRSGLYSKFNPDEQKIALERMQADLNQMKLWASNCRDNFYHLSLMMEAELARLKGESESALDLYERAIEEAHRSGFRRDEAMANELAGKCLIEQELPKAAEGYLRAAHYLYYRWGARRKVNHLQETYPELLRVVSSVDRKRSTTHSNEQKTTTWSDSDTIDMVSVMKASQAISGELRLGYLWKTTLEILLENVGGQNGWVIVRRDGRLWVQAHVEAGRNLPPQDVEQEVHEAMLPLSIINTALRMGEPVILNHASEVDRFTTDPYVVQAKPKSVLCLPIRRHRKFEGVIYLENSVTIGAFSPDRIEIVKLLSAQATISMENAKLYGDQIRLVEAQKRFVPVQFLESLGHRDIARVGLGEYVAREMTVMFSDLRKFTPLAERIGPREVIETLNGYFSCQSPPISKAGGFIDSFNGDEIMALFGGPPDAALAAGVEMRRALESFNLEAEKKGKPTLEMGMGMNTGPLVLGTVGGINRLKCGVVGDIVNLTSRIEQLTKRYNVPFLIGNGAYDRLGNKKRFSLRMIDRVAVKGKTQAVTLYEVLDANALERQKLKESTRDLLHSAFDHYFRREFPKAGNLLKDAIRLDPDDDVLRFLLERVLDFQSKPPNDEWNGVTMIGEK